MERSKFLLSICDRLVVHPSHPLINTPLQRGVNWRRGRANRFNGFRRSGKTVETVSPGPGTLSTALKRGVNEMQRLRMLPYRVAWALGLMILVLAAALASAAAEQILTVAVFDFDSKDEAVRDLGPK